MGKSQAIKKAVDKLDDAIKVGHDVAEVTPNTSTPKSKKQIYQFGGSKAEIAAQVSSFMANYEYSQTIFGITPPDFEEWCKEFEGAFENAPLKHRGKVLGNNTNPWGKSTNNRPRIVILNQEGKDTNKYVWCDFYPDRENKEEIYFITGTPFMCVMQILNIWNLKEIISKADFYQLLGYPPTEWLQKRPTQALSVTFVLYNYKTPPFRVTEKRPNFRVSEMQVPFIKKGALTFENIKAAFGGNNGLIWGDSSCRAWVSDDPSVSAKNKKGLPQVLARGSSYNDAKSTLKKVLQMSDAKIISMSENKADKEEDLNPFNNSSTNNRFYVHHLFILNSKLLEFNNQGGRKTKLGNLNTKKNKIIVIDDTKPEGFDRQVEEVFKWD